MGGNANQVGKWSRAFERSELVEPAAASTALLPVTLSAASETSKELEAEGGQQQQTSCGAVHTALDFFFRPSYQNIWKVLGLGKSVNLFGVWRYPSRLLMHSFAVWFPISSPV